MAEADETIYPWVCKHCEKQFLTKTKLMGHMINCMRRVRHKQEQAEGFGLKVNDVYYKIIPLHCNSKRILKWSLINIRDAENIPVDQKVLCYRVVLATLLTAGYIEYSVVSLDEYLRLTANNSPERRKQKMDMSLDYLKDWTDKDL